MLSVALCVLLNSIAHQLEVMSSEHPICSWKIPRCKCACLIGPHTRLEPGDWSSGLGSLLMLFLSGTQSPHVYLKLDSCFLASYGSKILQYGQILLHKGWGACDIESRTSLHTLLHDTSYNLTIFPVGVYRYLPSTVGIVKKKRGKIIFIKE